MHQLKAGQTAPDFITTDLQGKPVVLSNYRGKKVLLSFYRTAGCPVCNLRFHEIEKEAAFLRSKGVVQVAIYRSQAANLRTYLGGQTVFPFIIADPQGELYQLYNIERSMGKLISGLLFHGGIGQLNRGKKLFTRKVEDDGPVDLISTEFLIDEMGQVVTAYYGRYSGDFMPVADIRSFATQ